ncbi:Hypothetical predicted protein [Prunus dulcis]|uniref:Uncharacterized protein n=1 Tax=Prunus dulcis TaxID=3755 RepID=A0A5E4F913_PRUDU|nr:Hypothetical predicted protein [Prunus dulcis]
METGMQQGFGESVSKLTNSRDMRHLKKTMSDMIPYKLKINIRDNRCCRERNAKFTQYALNPCEFSSGSSNRPVFGFGGGAREGLLLMGAPRDQISTEVDNITSLRLAIITITSPVSIGKGIEMMRGVATKMKAKGDGTFQVVKKTLECLAVSLGRRMHELRELFDYEGDVRHLRLRY